jgi:hypothetical protein
MNTSRTGFRVFKTQKELYQAVDLQGGEQRYFELPVNSSFLED